MTESSDMQRSFRVLMHRLWAAVKRYKATVVAMVAFGFLEAFFTKLPLALVQPLTEEMTAAKGSGADDTLHPPVWLSPLRPPETATGLGAALSQWFRVFAIDLMHWLGLDLSPGMSVVVTCGLLSVACGVLGAVTIYFVQLLSRFFAIRIVADLRCELAQHFLALPLRFYGRQRTGEMISKVTNDAQVLQRSFELAADNIVVDPLMILFNIVLLAVYVPQAILVLLAMVPMMAIPLWRQGRKVQKRSSRSLQAMGEATESLNQILTGIRTVKAFQLEAARLKEFEANTQTFLDRTKRMLRAKGLSMAQTFIGYQVGFAALLVLLGYVVLVKGTVDVSHVVVIIAPLATTYQNVKRVTRSVHVLMESAGALEGIEQILANEVDQAGVGGSPIDAVRGDVELRDLHFSYGETPVLRGLNLKVRAGQTVALVGPSGGGKSTTIDLLLRFHDPLSGTILVDGVDLRSVRLQDYRAHTAVVSQQPFLFNTTIRENIAYGRPGASQLEIEAAARAANIHDFIISQPLGYDAMAGERGSNLSGGQMQRITIARAILRNPALLFLDEATSALDSENEELVQRALDELRRGRTSFVIAHRLSTIIAADLIVVLDHGRIVESGTHAELLTRSGTYRRMYELQTA